MADARIQDAFEMIEALEASVPLIDNEHAAAGRANIECAPKQSDALFHSVAYVPGEFSEVPVIESLQSMTAEGRRFRGLIYARRCASVAIPQIRTTDQADRAELYQRTVDILTPEIDHMKQFQAYHQQAVESFAKSLDFVAAEYMGSKNSLLLTPDELLISMARCVCVCVCVCDIITP